MNEHPDYPHPDEDLPPMVVPAGARPMPRGVPSRRPMPPPPPPRSGGSMVGAVLIGLILFVSLGLNLLLLLIVIGVSFSGHGPEEGPPIFERFWSNDEKAADKVAVIRVEGILVEEMMGYANKQVEEATKDPKVKAVVLRINSPGGTVTASEDLHRRLKDLRSGSSPRFKSAPAKHLVVSMGGLAASGGYYIAMPGEHIFAEDITSTGSIGVYASLPNIQKLANEHGVYMNLVKAGEIKASGSMFHELTPEEREPWQDSVNAMYGHFLKIVEDGRPHLKGLLTKDISKMEGMGSLFPTEVLPRDDKGNVIAGAKPVPFHRKIADGGIFTAKEAKKLRLIDEIGTLEDATKHAASLAGLTDYKVVVYDKPVTLLSLFGASSKSSAPADFAKIASAATPRIWYMTPNAEFAGILAAMGKE
jgi:protease-4